MKGYRAEDAKDKKTTMDTYWVPGVNNLGTYGRWAFTELTQVLRMEPDFEAKVRSSVNSMIAAIATPARERNNHGQAPHPQDSRSYHTWRC